MLKIIGGVIVIGGLVAGVAWWQSRPVMTPVNAPFETTLPSETGDSLAEKGMATITSIREAMGLGKSMQCSYYLNEGDIALNAQSTVVVDGQKFKSTTVMKDMTVYGLFDGETQYTWMSDEKQGMKMSKSCMEQMTKTVNSMAKPETPAATAKDMREEFEMAKNVSCEPASGVDWSLPSDVVFTDQCAMMEQTMHMMEQMKEKLPAGMDLPKMPPVAY